MTYSWLRHVNDGDFNNRNGHVKRVTLRYAPRGSRKGCATWAAKQKPRFCGAAFTWGAVVEEVRTVFARKNDATIYIPDLREKIAA